MALTDKVAYIKGLADGLGVSKDEKTGKVLTELISLLGEMAEKIDGVSDDCESLKQYVEEVDEDLEVLEDEVYGDDDDGDDDECECDDEDCDCCDCDDCDSCVVTCPNCGVCLELEDDDDPDHLVCPNCKKEFSLDDTDETCECCCTDKEKEDK